MAFVRLLAKYYGQNKLNIKFVVWCTVLGGVGETKIKSHTANKGNHGKPLKVLEVHIQFHDPKSDPPRARALRDD